MKVSPKSEAEVMAEGLWPADTYEFEVSFAEEQTSKAGNEMIMVKLDVYDKDGKRKTIVDYLLDTDGFRFKIRHFADSVGMLAEYEKGELRANELFNRTGRCKVFIQKDKNEQYPDKNSIRDYVKSSDQGKAAVKSANADKANAPLDDEIPFSSPLAA